MVRINWCATRPPTHFCVRWTRAGACDFHATIRQNGTYALYRNVRSNSQNARFHPFYCDRVARCTPITPFSLVIQIRLNDAKSVCPRAVSERISNRQIKSTTASLCASGAWFEWLSFESHSDNDNDINKATVLFRDKWKHRTNDTFSISLEQMTMTATTHMT